MKDIYTDRKEYEKGELRRSMLFNNPIKQLVWWIEEAVNASVAEPTAMVLSTCGKNGPSSRVVLLRGIDEENGGLAFYTSYISRKVKEIEEGQHKVALLFHWKEMERQVLIEGSVERASREMSERYFSSRPRKSQIAAWASRQDEPIPSRDALLHSYQEYEERFLGADVPCPQDWGGFICTPFRFEFWQGRQNRLHDRFAYELVTPHSVVEALVAPQWKITRLSP